ncbi:hypothetical protein AUP74_01793 [Microbulbifer aggregans]|uniref:Beta-barrel porin 2 n=2 Tax=Microbulbifer aggregans TaxID=1769779 RepID=A0A1C9W7U2_9GAMM|nr:hypothetical protein AUP74_01793 [Microbulbifer aggregans]
MTLSVVASAQNSESMEPAGLEIYDGLMLVPALGIEFLHDDNVARSQDAEIESWVTLINPNLLLLAESGKKEYGLRYSAEIASYFDSEEDDYVDHTLEAFGKFDINIRNYFEVSGSYEDAHEARGTGFSRGFGEFLEEPDRYQRASLDGRYRYGAQGAKGNIELLAGTQNTEFETALFFDGRDYDTHYGTGRFIYNRSGKTQLSLELTRRSISYGELPGEFANLDSVENEVLVGASWEATAKTTGSIQVGAQEKKFDDVSRSNFSSPTWEVGVLWEPKSHMAFDFSARRDIEESRGLDDFTDVRTLSLSWINRWSEKLSSTATIYSQDVDYGGLERTEDEVGSDINLNFQMKRWLGFSLGYSSQTVESNADGFGFERNIFFIGASASL